MRAEKRQKREKGFFCFVFLAAETRTDGKSREREEEWRREDERRLQALERWRKKNEFCQESLSLEDETETAGGSGSDRNVDPSVGGVLKAKES